MDKRVLKVKYPHTDNNSPKFAASHLEGGGGAACDKREGEEKGEGCGEGGNGED